jgi:hypothetical protein
MQLTEQIRIEEGTGDLHREGRGERGEQEPAVGPAPEPRECRERPVRGSRVARGRSLCVARQRAESSRHAAANPKRSANGHKRPGRAPNACRTAPLSSRPASNDAWAQRVRRAQYGARMRSGTMPPTQAFHAGPAAMPDAQYSIATA